mgnify:CR=1 FL=1
MLKIDKYWLIKVQILDIIESEKTKGAMIDGKDSM